MSAKTKKQFGIWIDGHHATIVGRNQTSTGEFIVLAHEKNPGKGANSNENAANNAERTLQHKFFKEISAHMENVDELHVTGTGQAQEQLIRFLQETPQYKNALATQSTTNKVSDDKLLEFISGKFN